HPASASAGYIRGRRRRRGTTRQPPETSWDNQPRGQDLWRPPSSKAITRTNWSEADTPFLEYGDGLGWGYYDGGHHWHGAPDRYRWHMEHFHAYGHGLRGYRDGGFRHEAAMHREAGYPHEETMRREGPVNHMEGRGEAMRAGSAHPAMMAGPAGRPGGPAGGFVRPGAM